MTSLQLAIGAGLLLGLAAATLMWYLVPSDPDLAEALDRLSPDYQRRPGAAETMGTDGGEDAYDKFGRWAAKRLPAALRAHTPHQDLAILQVSEQRFYGEKVAWAALGLVLPVFLTGFMALLGVSLPFVIPTIGSLAVAAVFFFVPNYNAADDAKKARREFTRALGVFIELVALERRSGASSQQALAVAAEVGDSWMFQRISRDIRRASYMARAPWDSLRSLSLELGVPELADLAEIMQQSGQDGAQIYETLRARSASLRSALLSAELGRANSMSERMYMPASLLGLVFMAILIAPPLLRFANA